MLGHTTTVTSLQIRSPTKGLMTGVVGDAWELQSDLQEAEAIDFLPMGEPQGDRYSFLRTEAFQTLEYFLGNWRSSMFVGTYYFSGKGFQKVGMVCLLMEKFYGENDPQTKACAEILVQGFKCLYDRRAAGDCSGAPPPLAYDQQWGGIVTTAGLTDIGCTGGTDFGGACYNDHHYHYGYYVVAAAIAAKILPAYRTDASFTAFVDSLIRDTTNPSRQDMHFPRFRSFDWFDLHSWSRGVTPSADGKDQESTSEEVNLLYGIHLWGGVTSRPSLKRLGTVMLSLAAASIREFFLMKVDNPHHHPDFARNHVTGIYFQNKATYTTWFGENIEYIHGIQMLPLSPALQLTRKRDFCEQEWTNILQHLPLPLSDPWSSIINSGSRAMVKPDEAYELLKSTDPGQVDDGLTRVWALYWAAVQDQYGGGHISPTPSTPSTPSPTPPPAVGTTCESQLNNMACAGTECYSCGDRIDWLQTAEGGSKSLIQARYEVCGEFPSDCGACGCR
jgi:endo-1,3(4)-beta-glucanase